VFVRKFAAGVVVRAQAVESFFCTRTNAKSHSIKTFMTGFGYKKKLITKNMYFNAIATFTWLRKCRS